MSQSQPKKSEIEVQEAGCIARRPFLRAIAGAGTVAVAGSAGIRSSQEAQAIAPVVWGGALAGSAALGWVMREYIPTALSEPPEGLTADALHNEIYNEGIFRESENSSTIVDNLNIALQAEQPAYADGKIAGIKALNDQLTQSEVQAAVSDEVDDYFTTLFRNLLRSWNETIEQFDSWENRLEDHPDLDPDDVLGGSETRPSVVYELPNGDEMDVREIEHTSLNSAEGHPFDSRDTWDDGDGTAFLRVQHPDDGDNISMANLDPDVEFEDDDDGLSWDYIAGRLEDVYNNVKDGLTLWVDTVYEEVQSGDIDISDLITPRERAEMMADEENLAPAIADLIALNANVDPERDATITLVDDDVTLRGTFARTANPDGEPLESGETYDPDTLTGDIYFSYDVSQGQGIWSEYQNGVDGGTVTFTAEPFESVEFLIETTAGETATVASSEFADNGDGTYSVDISGQVEDSITEIESVEMFPEDSETKFETVLLKQSFTIDKFEDSDGNEVQEANFEQSSESHDDTNYITQEEWDEMAERNAELIEKYEEAQSGGGGLFGGGGLLEGTNSTILIVVAAGLAAVGLLNN